MPVNAFHRGATEELVVSSLGACLADRCQRDALVLLRFLHGGSGDRVGRGRGGCQRLPRRHEGRAPQRHPPLRGVPTSSGVRAGRTRPRSHAPQTTRRRRQACLTTFHLARCMTALASDHYVWRHHCQAVESAPIRSPVSGSKKRNAAGATATWTTVSAAASEPTENRPTKAVRRAARSLSRSVRACTRRCRRRSHAFRGAPLARRPPRSVRRPPSREVRGGVPALADGGGPECPARATRPRDVRGGRPRSPAGP